MQQLNEKIIKINSKSVEQAVLRRLLYGRTIYLTNDFEARWLARKHCNLTVMKLGADFLGLNLIDSTVNRAAASFEPLHDLLAAARLMDYRSAGDQYPSDNRQEGNYKLMNERPVNRASAYEFESASFVQHFGLTFRMQSPYYRLFAQKISALKESSLIANLLHKWSRSSACDANRNLYSNSNDSNDLDLHNDKLDAAYGHLVPAGLPDYDETNARQAEEDTRAVHRSTDGSLDFARLNMAKFKKTENSSLNNVRTNHFRANLKSSDRQSYYAMDGLTKAGSLTGRLTRLLKQIANSSSAQHPWLNRICYLLALSLSLTCSIVLVEHFLVGAKRRGKCKADKQPDEQLLDENARAAEDSQGDGELEGVLDQNAPNDISNGNLNRTTSKTMASTKDRKANRRQSSKSGRQHSSTRLSELLEQPANAGEQVDPLDDLVAVCELSDLAGANCENYASDSLADENYRTDSRSVGAYRLCSADGTGYSADHYPDNTHRFANQQFHADPFTSTTMHTEHGAFVAFDGYSQVSGFVGQFCENDLNEIIF